MEEKWRDPCPRCGAEPDWPCEPIRPGKWPTVLRPHRERGAYPWWLKDRGYVQYTLVDEAGFKLFLWRRPSQPAVVREGWHPLADEE